ncbi:hypothetical protein DL93DRAFT_2172697 [Clavulina sp. PMI_390]|nr:hypothetical protein DL93DRAFT_2172697 [Clavulina sp. PMI_390]
MSAFMTRSNLLALFVSSALLFSPQGVEAVATPRAASNSYTCTEAFVPITASAQNVRFNAAAPKTQLELAAIVSSAVAINSNYSAQVVDATNPSQTISGTWKLYTKTCIPAKWNGNVQVLVHGLFATHSYFEYPYNKSLSYLDVAASEGNAVVNYDRLGIGASDHPDGINIVQSALDIEMLHQLVGYLKKRSQFAKATQWISVGHSYGSMISSAVMSKYPTDFTKVVLTGYSPTTNNNGVLAAYAFSAYIASKQNPLLFGRYNNDSSYFVTESASHDLYGFFNGPPGEYYSTDVFDNFVATKGAISFGQFLTMAAVTKYWPAQAFTGDVLIVTGVHDLPGCAGNCYQGSDGVSVLSGSNAVFPNAKSLATYIPGNTGHAVFHHYTAPAVFGVINSWLDGNYH